METTLFVGLAEGLGLDVAYSYTEALFDGGQFGGNRIPLVPRNKASAKLTYADFRAGGSSLASVYMGDRYAISDQANAQEQLPGLHDLRRLASVIVGTGCRPSSL